MVYSSLTALRHLDYSNEIDVELFAFIERYATNLTRWDLLLYFGQNPTASANAVGIAKGVRRNPQAVEKELDDLAYLGVLQALQNGKGRLYQLTRAVAIRGAVIRLAACYPRLNARN